MLVGIALNVAMHTVQIIIMLLGVVITGGVLIIIMQHGVVITGGVLIIM